MSVTKDDIAKVAKLARIQIDAEQVPEITHGINEILSLVDKMQQADTTHVKPLANPHDATQRLRADEVTAINERDKLMANAPESDSGLFLVPKVIE
ncbi:MAG: Asp-tRNA(Asn)/Glu-tRNA(Gln) amidotransferase subunit GatC [Pseudomonadales bacterium]|nr:Asp-tRNA(Asn)/Glu-tRNA(Gln) amidotransferase subunit GatC [Pseudomonadales bacterium]